MINLHTVTTSLLGSQCLMCTLSCHFTGDSHALHASRLFGESSEVHRQGSYATRETKKWVSHNWFLFFKNTIILNECIMWVCGFCCCKKGGKIEDFYYLARLSRLCQNPGVLFLIIAMFQCWTAAPSSLLSKSFYWSISSCVDSSQATRPLHYKRYTVSACRGHFLNVNCHKINFHACESEHWLYALYIQISQVCQLCQQSPRLFTNHAAQLHTLLVSIFNLDTVCA